MPSRRALLLLPLGLSSCALLQTSKPNRIFALTPLPPGQRLPCANPSIMVTEPDALQVLDTQRIAYRSGLEFQYYSGALWEDNVPTLLQHLLIASLRNRLNANVAESDLSATGARLTWDVLDFQVEPGNQIHVTLEITLTGQTRRFESRTTAASDRMVDLVQTFDSALADLFAQIAQWVASQPAAAKSLG